eukprot:2706132-Amphidinium_carterae.1
MSEAQMPYSQAVHNDIMASRSDQMLHHCLKQQSEQDAESWLGPLQFRKGSQPCRNAHKQLPSEPRNRAMVHEKQKHKSKYAWAAQQRIVRVTDRCVRRHVRRSRTFSTYTGDLQGLPKAASATRSTITRTQTLLKSAN